MYPWILAASYLPSELQSEWLVFVPIEIFPEKQRKKCYRDIDRRLHLRRQHVEVSHIIAEIDAQISKLQQARELLSGTVAKAGKGPGRPKGSKNAKPATATAAPRKRKLSPEGRKRIADAMKRRWAERRKQTAKSTPAAK
jgi:hypothetical protein